MKSILAYLSPSLKIVDSMNLTHPPCQEVIPTDNLFFVTLVTVHDI